MIDKRTYTDDNIRRIVAKYKVDYQLAQRAIFALGLVEALAKTGLQFTFKGGSSQMLLFPSPKRLSTDVDILVEPDCDIDKAIEKASAVFPFVSCEESIRKTSKSISKKHYRFKYQSPQNGRFVHVLLDVLFAKNNYPKEIEAPLKNDFLIEDEQSALKIRIPCPECLLGDKLTAFAPHTIGISFFSDGFNSDKRLEVIKQFFDIGTLYDLCEEFPFVRETYIATAKDEIAYRGNTSSIDECLSDSFQASLCILTWGKLYSEDYINYVEGFKRIAGHIVGAKLNPNSAYLYAAKIMLLCACIKQSVNPFGMVIEKQPLFSQRPYSTVNKVAKIAPEAFDIAAKAIRIFVGEDAKLL